MSTPVQLEWHEPGIPAYHIESVCGRYTVSRVTVTPTDSVYYIAWRVTRGERNAIAGRKELGSVRLALSTATNEQRSAARESMKRRCEEDAAA